VIFGRGRDEVEKTESHGPDSTAPIPILSMVSASTPEAGRKPAR
jgi:hypothetical protein